MFNVANYVVRAIESVQKQSVTNWELIVVDDCSQDDGAALVASFAQSDPRIRLIVRDRNGGAGAARNSGLHHARGEWLALLDADDVWRPHRVARLIEVAAETGADFVGDNQVCFDDALGRETGVATDFPHRLNRLTLLDLLKSERDGRFPLSLLQPLISISYLRAANLAYPAEIRFAEDMHLYAELLITGIKAVVVNEPMYVYTNPIGQMSRKRSKASRTDNKASTKVWIADNLLRRYDARLSVAEKLELLSYKKRAQQKHHSQTLSALRRERRWLSALLVALRAPNLTWRYMAKSSTLSVLGQSSAAHGSRSLTPLGPFFANHRNDQTKFGGTRSLASACD